MSTSVNVEKNLLGGYKKHSQKPIVSPIELKHRKKDIDDALLKIFGKKKIRRILLINPSDANKDTFDFDRSHRKRNSDYPPYGLLIVARHLLNNGYDVSILNLQHELSKECVLTSDKRT